RVLARIARAAHPPHIETGIGPSETKAERPATEKGFWNRIDATARCRAVEERDEATRGEQSPGKPDPEPLTPRRRKVGQAGLPARCRGWARPSGQTGPPKPREGKPVSEPPGGGVQSSDQAQPPTEPAPARAPGDERSLDDPVRKTQSSRH